VALVEVAGAYGIDANLGDDTNAPVILTDSWGRSEWAPGAYDSVIGVRQDGTDVVVLVETDVRGRISYSEHRFDATTGQEQGRAVAVDAAALPGLEVAYDADLNGDEQAGYVSSGAAIATAQGDDAALYAAGSGAFAVFNADGTGQPDLLYTSRGEFWAPGSGETVAGLRVDGGDVYLMLERDGAFSEQRFTPGNSLVETGAPVRLEGDALARAEVLYDIDFDGDTIIVIEVVARLDNAADPSIVEGQREAGADNGGVSLFEMTSGAFVVADAGDIAPGDPSTALSNPVTLTNGGNSWAPAEGEAIAVRELDGGGYGVIVRASTDSAPVWREQLFDATGESDGFATSLTLRQLVQLERAYDQDFDDNGYVTDVVREKIDLPVALRTDDVERTLYASTGDGFFVSEDDDKDSGNGEEMSPAAADFLFDDDAETELLESGFNGRPWEPAGASTLDPTTGTVPLAVRSLDTGGFAVLVARADDGFETRYSEQAFDAEGRSVGFMTPLTVEELEGLYLTDINNDDVIDACGVTYARDLQEVTLDGQTLTLSLSELDGLTVLGTGILVVCGSVGPDVSVVPVEISDGVTMVRGPGFELPKGWIIREKPVAEGDPVETLFYSLQEAVDDAETTSDDDLIAGDANNPLPLTISTTDADAIGIGADIDLTAGDGDNNVEFDITATGTSTSVASAAVASGGSITLGDGDNTLTLTAGATSTTSGTPSVDVLDGGELTLGSGTNRVTLNGFVSTQQGAWTGNLNGMGSAASISFGDGPNALGVSLDAQATAGGYLQVYGIRGSSTVTFGSAADSFVLKALASGDENSDDVVMVGLDENSTVSMGAGDDSVRLVLEGFTRGGTDHDIDLEGINDFAVLDLGAGDDTVVMELTAYGYGEDAEVDVTGIDDNAVVALGEGDNTLTMTLYGRAADEPNDDEDVEIYGLQSGAQVTAGAGNDNVTLSLTAIGGTEDVQSRGLLYSSMNLGDGNNALVIEAYSKGTETAHLDAESFGFVNSAFTGGDGDDTIELTLTAISMDDDVQAEGVKYGSDITLGQGNNSLTITTSATADAGGDDAEAAGIWDGSTVTAGAGDDTLTISMTATAAGYHGYVGLDGIDGSGTYVDLGDGSNTLEVTGIARATGTGDYAGIDIEGIADGAAVTLGSGDDTVLLDVKGYAQNGGGQEGANVYAFNDSGTTLRLGDGSNTLTASALADNVTAQASAYAAHDVALYGGADADTLSLSATAESDEGRSYAVGITGGSVQLYGGDDNLSLTVGVTGSGEDADVKGISGGATVMTGAGADDVDIDLTLTSGTTYAVSALGIDAATLETGDGDDTVTIDIATALGSPSSETIRALQGATVDLGAGNDELTLTGVGNDIAANSSVTAGEGDDTISGAGVFDSTVDLGDGNDSLILTGDLNSTVLGGAGDDIIKVGGNTSPTSFIALGDGSNRVEIAQASQGTIHGGLADDTVDVGGFAASGSFALGGGEDVIVASDGADISGVNAGSATTAETLDMSGAVTMSVAQHDAFTAIDATGGADEITLSDAGTVTGDVDVESYVLANGDQTFTLGSAGQSVTTGTGAVTIDTAGFDVTGTLDGVLATSLTLDITASSDLTGATLNGVDAVTVAAGATLRLTETQASGLTATGSGSVIVEGLTSLTDLSGFAGSLDVTVETTSVTDVEGAGAPFDVSAVDSFDLLQGALSIDSADLGASVNFTDGAATVAVGTAETLTKTLSFEATATNTLTLATGSDISGATLTNVDAYEVSGAVTMSVAQHDSGATIDATGGADEITLVGSANSTADEDIEAYVLDGSVLSNMLTLSAAGQSVTGGLADDTVVTADLYQGLRSLTHFRPISGSD
jgi:hypothetical protein